MLKDFEIGLPSKLPSKKDDLFCFSFNFENLIKTIDYLHKYNLALFSKLQNFNERMIKFEEVATEFQKVKEDTLNLQLYSKEHETLIKECQNKIVDNENKIKELSKKIDKNEIDISNNNDLITTNKKNIDILLKEKNEKKKNEKDNQNANINAEEIKKYMAQNVFKGSNDRDIDLIKNNINIINEKLKEMQTNMDSRNNQMERNLSNIVNSIGGNGDISIQMNTQGKTSDANLFKMTMLQIEKNKKYFQEMIDQYHTTQEKLKQDILWINNDIAENKKNYQSLSKTLEEYSEEKQYYLTFQDIKEMSKNVDIFTSKIPEFSVKTDLDELKSDFNIRFNKINAKLKELIEKEGKIEKNLKNRGDEDWNPEDLNFVPVTKRISELISDLLKSEGKNIDLSKNKHFIELMKLNQQNSSELNKNMKNYLDLKSFISSNLSQKDIEKMKKELDDFKNEFKLYKTKLIEIVNLIGGFDFTYDEKEEKEKEKVNEEKNVEKKIKQSEETIKGKIDYLTEYVQDLSNKVMKSEKKINSISKELKDDMKANLRVDTYKVVEQFKLKLNSFTDKFENELKNKIDKIGLNVFENKLNSKLSIDLKDKLNKNDLKKNNFMINKKIDTLENKISKTLVDTIIDLQMDDVPLLIKKNQKNIELCASCNRPLNDISNNNNIGIGNKTIEHTQLSTTPNYILTPKNKLKSISSLKRLPVI